jgi:hypothetical protein
VGASISAVNDMLATQKVTKEELLAEPASVSVMRVIWSSKCDLVSLVLPSNTGHQGRAHGGACECE